MFPNREENSPKAALFSFCIKQMQKNISNSSQQKCGGKYSHFTGLGPTQKWKIPPFFFHCASCSAQEVAPMLPAVSLALLLQSSNSVLFQSNFYFRIKVAALRIWKGGHRRVAKGRQKDGFLIYVLKPTAIFQSPYKTYSNASIPFFTM